MDEPGGNDNPYCEYCGQDLGLADEPEAFVGVNEAAQVTGYSRTQIIRYCNRGMMPFYQPAPGANYSFRVSELLEWMRGEWTPGSEEV
jgi:excisionase family DNA binding protein